MAARQAAVRAAQSDLAIMELSRFRSGAHHMERAHSKIEALARP